MAVELILDAGHGGFDNGASYQGAKEKDQALQLTKDVGQKLTQAGYDVAYIRTEDVYESPYQKAEKANELGGDVFISFHRNYAVEDNLYHGVQALVYDLDENSEAIALGRALTESLEQVGFANLGLEAVPDLIVLRETQMPAVLLEVGFINSDEDTKLWEGAYEQIVDRIVAAIQQSFPQAVGQQQSFPQAIEQQQRAPQSEQQFFVQTGLFRYDINAAYQLERLQMQGYEGQIHYEAPFYGVWAGGVNSVDEAVQLQEQLRKDGYRTLIVSV